MIYYLTRSHTRLPRRK